MPRIQRNQNAAVIEVSIPLNLSRGSVAHSDDDDSCFICAHAFCDDDMCTRAMTNLRCCSQLLCCGCVVKVARRCKCTDDCEAVIAVCPFCREIVPIGALEVFLATKAPCKECAKAVGADAPTPTSTPMPEEVAQATPAQDAHGTRDTPPDIQI